jgi:gamma-glutamylcyclotransferase
MIYYFTYGSNLHPLRLTERVSSAEFVGVAKFPHHSLRFHKKGIDGSSKCNIFHSGKESDLIYGAIYTIQAEHKTVLDRFESNGSGYIDIPIRLHHNSREYPCFTYFAQKTYMADNLKPYHWYKQLVVLGCKYLKFPDYYISFVEAVESIDDPDFGRRKEMELLIEDIINYR